MNYRNIPPYELDENFIRDVKDWMLVSACDKKREGVNYNGMTASWGGVGFLWHKSVFWCVVRPQRHTLEFCENSEYISLSFFDEKHHKALEFCGKESGRDHENKLTEAGLTPIINDGIVDFEEARLTLVGKKLYVGEMKQSGFLDKEIIPRFYPDGDFHKLFVCEITEARERKE